VPGVTARCSVNPSCGIRPWRWHVSIWERPGTTCPADADATHLRLYSCSSCLAWDVSFSCCSSVSFFCKASALSWCASVVVSAYVAACAAVGFSRAVAAHLQRRDLTEQLLRGHVAAAGANQQQERALRVQPVRTSLLPRSQQLHDAGDLMRLRERCRRLLFKQMVSEGCAPLWRPCAHVCVHCRSGSVQDLAQAGLYTGSEH
jgi:hypothetical protein